MLVEVVGLVVAGTVGLEELTPGVLVGVGVFATVESPDPQPASSRPSATPAAALIAVRFDTAHRTTGNVTVSGCADLSGAARLGIRLPLR